MKPPAHLSACSGVNLVVLAQTFDKNIWERTRIKPYRTRVHQANTTFSLSAYQPFLSIAFYYHSLPEFHSIIHVITFKFHNWWITVYFEETLMSTVAGAFDNKTRDFKTNAKNNNSYLLLSIKRKQNIQSRVVSLTTYSWSFKMQSYTYILFNWLHGFVARVTRLVPLVEAATAYLSGASEVAPVSLLALMRFVLLHVKLHVFTFLFRVVMFAVMLYRFMFYLHLFTYYGVQTISISDDFHIV